MVNPLLEVLEIHLNQALVNHPKEALEIHHKQDLVNHLLEVLETHLKVASEIHPKEDLVSHNQEDLDNRNHKVLEHKETLAIPKEVLDKVLKVGLEINLLKMVCIINQIINLVILLLEGLERLEDTVK